MNDKKRGFADDPTEAERRKNLTEKQVADLELAGGVEGGMQAGSAGGPEQTSQEREQDASDEEGSSGEPPEQAGR
jgi:hypothetical protein